MLQQVIDGLDIKPNGTYVDCTFGGGGHSKAILKKLNDKGRLIAFDQDEDSRKNIPDDDRIIFVPHNFRHLQRFLRLHKIGLVDGVMADLGVSSHQFNNAERGFSTRLNAALDMRMNTQDVVTAAQIINAYSAEQLHKLFEEYGEVTNSKTLANLIAQRREITSIKTINEFKSAISEAVKGNPNKYFAQVFQALRIEVNDEIGALKEMLLQLPPVLKPSGRVAIITFHSLEDRLVKNFFRASDFNEKSPDDLYGRKQESAFTIINKKPIVPHSEEIKLNPRSRSAKLRIAERKESFRNVNR